MTTGKNTRQRLPGNKAQAADPMLQRHQLRERCIDEAVGRQGIDSWHWHGSGWDRYTIKQAIDHLIGSHRLGNGVVGELQPMA
ncbi:hypothetical protein D3C77_661430 [compost metagenome]